MTNGENDFGSRGFTETYQADETSVQCLTQRSKPAFNALLQGFIWFCTPPKIAPFRPFCPRTGTETGTNVKTTYDMVGRSARLLKRRSNDYIQRPRSHIEPFPEQVGTVRHGLRPTQQTIPEKRPTWAKN